MDSFWDGFEKRARIVITTKNDAPSTYKTDHRVVGGLGGGIAGATLGIAALSKLEKAHPHIFGGKKGLALLAGTSLLGGTAGWEAGKKAKLRT